MTPRIIKDPPAPGTDKWRRMITASKVPGLLGVSRYVSQYTVWHEMAGLVEPRPFNEDRGQWGHLAEQSLAAWWTYKHPGWQLNPPRRGTTEIAYENDDLPFPNLATLDRRAFNRRADATSPHRFHIVECKTANTLADWGRPGEPDAVPTDYYTQALFQMGVSGIHAASVVVLGPRAEPEIHTIEWDEDLFNNLVSQIDYLYQTILAGTPPELDDSETTYETVRGLHPDIDPDKDIFIDEAKAREFIAAARGEDEAKAAHRAAKIELAELMDNARRVMVGDPDDPKTATKIADRRTKLGGNPYVQINKAARLTKES